MVSTPDDVNRLEKEYENSAKEFRRLESEMEQLHSGKPGFGAAAKATATANDRTWLIHANLENARKYLGK